MLQNPQIRRVFVHYITMTLITIKVPIRSTFIPNSVKRGRQDAVTKLFNGVVQLLLPW